MKCIVQNCEHAARRSSNYCERCYQTHVAPFRKPPFRRPMPNAVIAGVIFGVIGIVILVDIIKKF